MSRIKEKISAIVSSQLPEFIQTDYTTFVAFVEAYYRFLEQDQGAYELIQNSRSYSDIDKTTPAFVKYFLKNYAKDIPTSTLANQKVLIKKIKDLYESKGSELSFKLLFRILYNTDISIFYPYEFVLRASGGTWQQLNSLRLQTVFGNREDLLNRSITYTTGGIVYTTPIIEVKNLARVMLPNGNVGYRKCGADNAFDCIVVTWAEADPATCDPKSMDGSGVDDCYILQVKVW